MSIRLLLATSGLLLLVGCRTSENADERSELWHEFQFVNETETRGLSFKHVSGATGEFLMPEIKGGGVALIDLDNDEDLDAYFVQSGNVSKLDPDHRNTLFLNDGSGNFSEHNAGDASRNLGYGMGVTTGDYANDGDVDLFVTNLRSNALLQNNGSARFKEIAAAAGLDEPGWGTSAEFMDFDNEGWLDLFVVNYID